TMEMLDKKEIQAIFLFRSKMGLKASELLTNVQCSKKFCRGNESLENEEHRGWPSEVVNDQLRAIIKADPLTVIKETAQELSVNHSVVVRHLKHIGKVKKLDKWVSHELTANKKKNRDFELSPSLILCNNNELFLNRIVMCDKKMDFIPQPLKALSKAKLAPKKIMVTVWWSAASLIHYRFLNPNETITSGKYAQQIDEMHQKLQYLQPALLQKLNELGYKVWPHQPYSPDRLPTNHHFFKHLDNFLQGKHFHNQQEAENAFQEFIKSRSTDFYAIGINQLISHWKKCVIVIVPILLNKDVCEPNYNALKFMA
ncbi:hypothetical protein FD755_023089, partial [Muntiacus reevesi]